MKKIVSILLSAITTGILLSSCGTNTSVIKRHYNKGYYVSRSAGKHEVTAGHFAEKEKSPKLVNQWHTYYPDSYSKNDLLIVDEKKQTENKSASATNNKHTVRTLNTSKEISKKHHYEMNSLRNNQLKKVIDNSKVFKDKD